MVGSSISKIERELGTQSLEFFEQDNHPVNISKTLSTLPSYIGNQDDRSVILPVPFTGILARIETQNINAQALLKTPMTFILTLEEVLCFKSELWT